MNKQPNGNVHRYTIALGIISGIGAWIVISSVLDHLSHLALHLIGNLWQDFMDSTYRNAVLVNDAQAILIVAAEILTAFFGTLILGYFVWNGPKEKRMPRLAGIATGLYLGCFGTIAIHARIVGVHANYERRMSAISQSISDDERTALMAEWNGITSRADYYNVMAEIRRVAGIHNIRLPPNGV